MIAIKIEQVLAVYDFIYRKNAVVVERYIVI